MSVPSPTDFIQYTLSTNPQVLSVPFVFSASADLLVLDSKASPPVTLVQGSDYTVTGGLGSTGTISTISGGTSGVQVGDVITISRNVPLTQLTNFTNTGPFTAKMVGDAVDKLTEIVQQINQRLSRAIQFQGDETLSGVISKSARAGNIQAYDVNGGAAFLVPALTPFGSYYAQASSIAAMKAIAFTTATSGALIQLLGYYSNGDGGGGQFYVDKADTTTPDNGGTIIVASDGTRIKRIYSTQVFVKWFGCKGDGVTDDTSNFRNAVLVASQKWLILDSGIYLISSIIDLPRSIRITGPTRRGAGGVSIVSNYGASLTARFAGPVLRAAAGSTQPSDITLENFEVIGDKATYGTGNGIEFTNIWNATLQSMVVASFGSKNIAVLAGCTYITLRDVYSAQAGTNNVYLNGEFCNIDSVATDAGTDSVYIDAAAHDTTISGNCVLEGYSTSGIKIINLAVDCTIRGVKFNGTNGGSGIICDASRTCISDCRVFSSSSTAAGIDLTGNSFESKVCNCTAINGGAGSRGARAVNGGLCTLTGNIFSGASTGLETNFSTFYSVVTNNILLGPTNSLLHTNGFCMYSENRYDNGSGMYKAPTISAGFTTCRISGEALGNSYAAVVPAATGTVQFFDPVANQTIRVLVANP